MLLILLPQTNILLVVSQLEHPNQNLLYGGGDHGRCAQYQCCCYMGLGVRELTGQAGHSELTYGETNFSVRPK